MHDVCMQLRGLLRGNQSLMPDGEPNERLLGVAILKTGEIRPPR